MSIQDIDFERFFQIYIFTGITVLVILIFYDWGLFKLQDIFRDYFYTLKKKLLYRPALLVWAFRADNLSNQFIKMIRLNMVGYGSGDTKEMKIFNALSGRNFNALFQLLISLFTSKFGLLILAVSCLIYFRPGFSMPESSLSIGEIWYSAVNLFQVLVSEINNFLVLIPGLIIVAAILITAYHTGMKGKYHAAIKQANKEYLIDLVNIHRKLSKEISSIVNAGSKNLNRALEVYHKKPYSSTKDLIVKYRMLELSPYIVGVEENEVTWIGDKRNYYIYRKNKLPAGFKEIEAIDRAFDIIDKAKTEGKFYDLLSLSKLDKKVWELWELCFLDRETLNEILFTESGLKKMVEKANTHSLIYKKIHNGKPTENVTYYNEQILTERKEFNERIDDSIIHGIELLISLMEYIKAVDKIINFRRRSIRELIIQLLKIIGLAK